MVSFVKLPSKKSGTVEGGGGGGEGGLGKGIEKISRNYIRDLSLSLSISPSRNTSMEALVS